MIPDSTNQSPVAMTDAQAQRLLRELPEDTSVMFGKIPVTDEDIEAAIACAKHFEATIDKT